MGTDPPSLNQLGIDLEQEGRIEDAEGAYRAAAVAAPGWAIPWYNLGLMYKRHRRWTESVQCNERAVELDPDDGDAWWNLGIAATALGDWDRARRAWTGCGIDVPSGAGELRMELGPVPVRLNADADAEVVWCDRIDPARAVVRNIPFPESGFREGDTVLHDGAPNGTRMWGEREYPVFDALQLLQRSRNETYEATVEVDDVSAISALEAGCDAAAIVMEDWQTVAWLCRQCSEGTPHADHQPERNDDERWRRIGFSAGSEAAVREALAGWTAAVPGARVISVRCATAG